MAILEKFLIDFLFELDERNDITYVCRIIMIPEPGDTKLSLA